MSKFDIRNHVDKLRRDGGKDSDYGDRSYHCPVCDAPNFKVNIKNSTDQISNVSIQGPKSRDILKKLIFTPPTQPAIDELESFRFTICRVEDLQGIPLIISRTCFFLIFSTAI